MAGEKLTASTLKDALKEIRVIYKAKSNRFELITEAEYLAIERDEREDSDNHLNLEKLEKGAKVIDLAYYKYLPDRKIAYKVILRNNKNEEITDYFLTTPEF